MNTQPELTTSGLSSTRPSCRARNIRWRNLQFDRRDRRSVANGGGALRIPISPGSVQRDWGFTFRPSGVESTLLQPDVGATQRSGAHQPCTGSTGSARGGAGHSISWRWTPGCPWGPSRPGLSRDEHSAVGCRTRSVAARPHSTGLSRRTVAHQFARLRFPSALAASMAAPRWDWVPHLSGRGYPGTVSNAPDGRWLCTEAPNVNARRDRRRMNSWPRYAPSRSPYGGQYLEWLRQARSEPSLG